MRGSLNYGNTILVIKDNVIGGFIHHNVYGWTIEEQGSRYYYVVSDTRLSRSGPPQVFIYDKRNDKNGYTRTFDHTHIEHVLTVLYQATGIRLSS